MQLSAIANRAKILTLSRCPTRIKRFRHFDLTSNCAPYKPRDPSGILVKSRLFLRDNQRKTLFLFESRSLSGYRYFSAKQGEGSDAEHPPPPEDDGYNPQVPATVAVPDVWPHVPVIAISRSVVFPRFIKLIEVIGCACR